MAKDQSLLIKINGDAKNFADEMDKARKKTKDLEKALSTTAKVSAAAFLALAAAVGATVVRFAAFEKGFSSVVTLLDKGSFKTKSLEKGIESLKKGIISLSAKSGESLETLNKGLFDLVSSGVAAEDAISTLAAATELAIAGSTTTDIAVKALTATMTSFGDAAGTATEISEKFFAAQKFGLTTVGELATEFNKVAGVADELGLSFDETLASLSALTAGGAKPTTVAATQLKAVFTSLVIVQSKLKNESAAVQDALNLQNIKQRGLVASLDLLKTATGGNISEMQRLVGSAEALAAVSSLTGAQSELYATQIDEIGNASKRAAIFQEALKTKQETMDQAMKRLRSSADAVAVVFGEQFAPTINAAANALSSMAQSIAEMDKETLSTIATITKWALGILGLITVVTTLTLGYIKMKRALILTSNTLKISAAAQKIWNFAMILGRKAALIFSTGVRIATGSVRGLVGATGIGLVLVALSIMAANMKETKAVAIGVFEALKVVIGNFAKGVKSYLTGIGTLLLGVFTADLGKIKEGLKGIGNGLKTVYTQVGKGAGAAFSKGYAESIKNSEAAELPGLDLGDAPPGEKKKDTKKEKAAEVDTAALDKLVAKEKEAAGRIREIRKQENDILEEQNQLAALKRVEIKDTELKSIHNEEVKSSEELLKLKSQQLQAFKNINQLESENAVLQAKEKLSAKEQVLLDANERELEIITGQLDTTQELIANRTAEELEMEAERGAAKLERIQEQYDEEQELQMELQELTDEQRALLDEEDIEKFRANIQTKRDIEKGIAGEQLTDNLNRRKTYLKDEAKHGKTVADLNAVLSSKAVQLADQTAGELVKLTNSKNSTLKGIGKAAALTQVGIKTAEGAISAYSAMAGIPYIGPFLGIAAAAALIAYGGEQASSIASAQQGGIVPGVTAGGSRDRVPALLEPGELVVPRALAPNFIQAVGSPEAGNSAGGGAMEIVIGFTDNAFEIIEENLIERRRIDGRALGALG